MILELFTLFLKKRGVSPRTQKNYVSDVRCFWKWVSQTPQIPNTKYPARLASRLEAGGQIPDWFSLPTLQSYKKFLVQDQGCSTTTINRRLVGLRQFGEFLVATGWLKENPAKMVSGIRYMVYGKRGEDWEKTLKQFKQDLKDRGQKETTIKNYLGDVRQFLKWVVDNMNHTFLVAGN